MASLLQDVAAQILDLLRALPAGNPYEVLKDCLTTIHSLNNYQRFEALVSLPLTCDQKLSHLMNRMLMLLSDDYKPDFILQGLFLCRLPIKVWSICCKRRSKLFQSRISSPVNLLAGQLEDVQVNTVSTRTCPTPSTKQPPTPAPFSLSSLSPGPCWYHKKHGDKAQNCRKPCLESEN